MLLLILCCNIQAKTFEEDGATITKLEELSVGSAIVHAVSPAGTKFCVSLFRGFGRLSTFVSKEEAACMIEELRPLVA